MYPSIPPVTTPPPGLHPFFPSASDAPSPPAWPARPASRATSTAPAAPFADADPALPHHLSPHTYWTADVPWNLPRRATVRPDTFDLPVGPERADAAPAAPTPAGAAKRRKPGAPYVAIPLHKAIERLHAGRGCASEVLGAVSSEMRACGGDREAGLRHLATLAQLCDPATGGPIRPTVMVFQAAITSSGIAERPEDSAWWFWQMLAHGIVPDIRIYRAAIRACALCRRADLARDILSHLVDNSAQTGITPPADVFQRVIEAHAAEGRPEAAFGLLRDLLQDGAGLDHQPVIRSCNRLIAACGRQDAIDLFKDLLALGPAAQVWPDVDTYTALLTVCRPEDETVLLAHCASAGLLSKWLGYDPVHNLLDLRRASVYRHYRPDEATLGVSFVLAMAILGEVSRWKSIDERTGLRLGSDCPPDQRACLEAFRADPRRRPDRIGQAAVAHGGFHPLALELPPPARRTAR